MTNNSPSEIINAIRKANNIIVTIDSRVDADCLACAIILNDYLKSTLQKKIKFVIADEIPDRYIKIFSKYSDFSFLDQNINPNNDIDFKKYDLHICIDSGTLGHVSLNNDFKKNDRIKLLNIDHHSGNEFYGELNYVFAFGAAATVLYKLFEELNIKINPELADVYYIAILFDTGFFQYVNATSYDFLVVSKLIGMGAKSFEIIHELTFNENFNTYKTRGIIFTNLKFINTKRIAYSTLSLEELAKYEIDFEEVTESLPDMIKRLEGTDFVFVVAELENNKFKISLRSHALGYDVSVIAKKFGGGGHRAAAGAIIEAKSIEEAVNTVFKAI